MNGVGDCTVFQNGARQYFGAGLKLSFIDVRGGEGVCFLLWGEPGLGWVLSVVPWHEADRGDRER
jgi:hypothetical protein